MLPLRLPNASSCWLWLRWCTPHICRRKRLSARPPAHDSTACFRSGLASARTGRTAIAKGYAELPNEVVHAANGVEYAYRDTRSDGPVPLVLLQHFRGNLDN